MTLDQITRNYLGCRRLDVVKSHLIIHGAKTVEVASTIFTWIIGKSDCDLTVFVLPTTNKQRRLCCLLD